jgi:hypothetical protein
MKATDYIAIKLNKLPNGYVFTYTTFDQDCFGKAAVIKALNRMAEAGKIAKLAKGKYYKPENTPFGALQPNQTQVVKDLLEADGKPTGYLTGYSMYNRLGLTSQISNTLQIGKNQVRPTFKRERYTIAFVNQKNTINKRNIPFLQLLDALRYIKKIPDTSVEKSCARFLAILQKMEPSDLNTLVRLALKYPPATRALLGALLDNIVAQPMTEPLFKSLNPITKYKLKGAASVLPTAQKWNLS